MLSRGVRHQILARKDPALPFRKIAPLLAASDVAFVNLEAPFSDRGPYLDSGMIFHAGPEMIAGLSLARIAVASTANNHSRDCASYGVEYTVKWLREHQIEPVGTADSSDDVHNGVVLTRNGTRFGFLGYTYNQQNGNWKDIDGRIAMMDPVVVCRDVKAIRRRADVVIVSMHGGVEYQTEPSELQIKFAHAAIDAGARAVIGHHPHVIQAQENYRGSVIFYSLGNFVFDQFQREATQRGELAQLSFAGTQLIATHAIRVKITATGPEVEE